MNRPKCFYYISHKDNLKSILKRGILSRSQIKAGLFAKIGLGQKTKSIHDESIIQSRKSRKFKNRSLWDYANVYFQARNPMLYRVIKEFGKEEIVVLQINSDILDIPGSGITDGNSASPNAIIFEDINEGLSALDKTLFEKGHWINIENGKRKIMAEALIPDQIPTEKITSIYTNSQQTSQEIKEELKILLNNIPVIFHPWIFFHPKFQKNIPKKISLVKGDMFFSKMKTFTISVNTVGVMGKGLASRAKYQFPDVYVLYQDICRQRRLKMGVPYLYKREENYEKTLIEDTNSTVTENGNRWFLLFPTKNHWREKSPLEGIEKGLQHLVAHYKNQEIESIALPALGCGLGGLDWKDVGPLMCRYLDKMDIPSSVYLPLEGQIPEKQLSAEFLLNYK